MKKFVVAMFVLIAFGAMCEVSEARKVRRTRTSKCSCIEWKGRVEIRKDDQAACQKEAEHMAKHKIRGHVFGCIGRFEGCGWGARGIRRCSTCCPSSNMTLTGDAEVTSKSGEKFRVRSWR